MPPKGYTQSPEARKKMREGHRNSIYVLSDETRKKMSEAAKKFVRENPGIRNKTEAQKLAMSKLLMGRKGTPHTQESKRKLSEAQRGEKSSRWKGGRKMRDGYVLLLMPDHPNAYFDKSTGKKRYVLEHRYVMSQMLGRPLDKYDIVHHINANRADNRPENLEHLRGDNRGCRYPIVCPKCNHAF